MCWGCHSGRESQGIVLDQHLAQFAVLGSSIESAQNPITWIIPHIRAMVYPIYRVKRLDQLTLNVLSNFSILYFTLPTFSFFLILLTHFFPRSTIQAKVGWEVKCHWILPQYYLSILIPYAKTVSFPKEALLVFMSSLHH